MRKPDLAANIAEQIDVSKDKAGNILNVILDEVTNALSRAEQVSLIGFGTFTQRARSERKGKNPQTGEEITIPASNSVVFKPGKALKEAVNGS